LSLGDFRRARECFQSNIQSLEGHLIRERFGEMGLPAVLTRLWLVHVLAECGEFAEGIAKGQEGLAIAESVGQPLDLISANRGLGHLYLRKGDLDEAHRFLERSRELSQKWDITVYISGISAYTGYADVLSGRLGDGIALLEQGIEELGTTTGSSGYAWSLACLGEAYGLANREEDAIRTVQRALDFARAFQRRPQEAWALRTLGEIASYREPPEIEKAEASYHQAMALADELGMRPLVGHCNLGLGKLLGLVDKHAEAREHLVIAMGMYREMEMRFWLEQAETELCS
jgi:tetratricopeptide (TPR) repeat protein